jgi:hypothetical protein
MPRRIELDLNITQREGTTSPIIYFLRSLRELPSFFLTKIFLVIRGVDG